MLIEPSNFDLIIIGTGLPESIIAAAASSIGKKVIQIDPNPIYGTHYSSFTSLSDFTSFLHSQSQSPTTLDENDEHHCRRLVHRPLYSHIETKSFDEPIGENKFNVDLSGPRVLLCADSMLELISSARIHRYVKFMSPDAIFIPDSQGSFVDVPHCHKAIFRDANLNLFEKLQLGAFLKIVQINSDKEAEGDRVSEHDLEKAEGDRISENDWERPFCELLDRRKLSHRLKSTILYAIVLADCDQDGLEQNSKDVISTKCGIELCKLYCDSIGSFPEANGPMLYPVYGQGELPQAFCRRAAVKGCIHVLRMPITAVLMGEGDGTYKGVKLASGQELYSTQLVLAPSFTIAPQVAPSVQVINSHEELLRNAQRKVARAICITKNSIKPEVANCLVIFPPKSLCSEQRTSIRALQLSSNLRVVPPGMFVTYLSVMCDKATEGQNSLNAAINALFSMPVSTHAENNGTDHLSGHTDAKPCLLWSTSYIQELPMCQDAIFDSIRYTPMPDEHLHYNDILNATIKLFKEIYPGEESFFVKKSSDKQMDDTSELD